MTAAHDGPLLAVAPVMTIIIGLVIGALVVGALYLLKNVIQSASQP